MKNQTLPILADLICCVVFAGLCAALLLLL